MRSAARVVSCRVVSCCTTHEKCRSMFHLHSNHNSGRTACLYCICDETKSSFTYSIKQWYHLELVNNKFKKLLVFFRYLSSCRSIIQRLKEVVRGEMEGGVFKRQEADPINFRPYTGF